MRLYDGAGTPLFGDELELMSRLTRGSLSPGMISDPRLEKVGMIRTVIGWLANGRWGPEVYLTRRGELSLRTAILDGWTPPELRMT